MFRHKDWDILRVLEVSAVYGIVKRFKGSINVSSELSAGTTFNIYLHVFMTRRQT